VRRGRPRREILTAREWEVLALLREGLTNRQIAQRLGVSENTAKYHVAQIFSKLGVNSRKEAAAWRPEGEARGFPVIAGLAWLANKATSSTVAKLAVGGITVATAAALLLLLFGVFVMKERHPVGITSGDLGKIAYVQGGDLWVKSLPDGAPLRIAAGATHLRWSPSGSWLLVAKGRSNQSQGVQYAVSRNDGSQRHELPARRRLGARHGPSCLCQHLRREYRDRTGGWLGKAVCRAEFNAASGCSQRLARFRFLRPRLES